MGTVQYMSPEQARAKNVGVGTDIWSLAIVMYELLTGQVPFSGETPSHVMVSLMEDELPPLTGYVNVPTELGRIVTKALRKKPRERYHTTSELTHDLKNLKQELQLEARLKEVLDLVPTSNEVTDKNNGATRTKITGAQLSALAKSASETVALQSLDTRSHSISSAEYLVNGLKSHKRAWAFAAMALVIVVTSAYVYTTRKTNVASTNEAIDSVAVLPFVNVNNDASAEYLSDGISDSVIGSLSRLPNLKVSAFSSVLRYKGKQTDPQTVGRELNVRAVLMGRLTLRGDEIFITTELIDVRDNNADLGRPVQSEVCRCSKASGRDRAEIGAGLRLKLSSDGTAATREEFQHQPGSL